MPIENMYADMQEFFINERREFRWIKLPHNFSKADVNFRFLEPSTMFEPFLMEAMRTCRGVQFGCGTIILQDQIDHNDSEVPFTLTPNQRDDHGISEITRIPIPREDETYVQGTLILLKDITPLPKKQRELMDFIIHLIISSESPKKSGAKKVGHHKP